MRNGRKEVAIMWCTVKTNKKGTRYTYRERFTDKRTGKIHNLTVTLNSNTRHAQKMAQSMLMEKFNELIETKEEKRNELNETLTFKAVCHEWIEDTAVMVKGETTHNHAQYCRRIIQGLSSDKFLFRDFTPVIAERIVHSMYYKEKLSFAYCSATLTTIKAVMRYAKKAGYIDNIYEFEAIKLKRRPATPAELAKINNKFLNKQELKSCLEQLHNINTRIALAMEFISLTGLRCGEMTALRWQDVDFDKKSINVNGTIVKSCCNGDTIQRGTPKNIYSYRDVDLNQRAIDILKWFKLENKKMELWGRKGNCISRSYHDRGYIFTTRSGAPYNIQFINTQLRKVVIPGKKISTHIFRHTHISMLAEMNIPVKAIMQRVGHNDPNTTLQIYTHVTENMRAETRTKLEQLSI